MGTEAVRQRRNESVARRVIGDAIADPGHDGCRFHSETAGVKRIFRGLLGQNTESLDDVLEVETRSPDLHLDLATTGSAARNLVELQSIDTAGHTGLQPEAVVRPVGRCAVNSNGSVRGR